MKYFRVGYCPPNPGPNGSPYGRVRAYSEEHIDMAISYAKENPNMPLYMKPSYGKAYKEITFKQLEEYKFKLNDDSSSN